MSEQEEQSRYSCPDPNCLADEFWCKENGRMRKGKFTLNGTATCTVCNRTFTIPSEREQHA